MTICGDGIHDDTMGIQALLDTRARLVKLPMPQKMYMISKPLVIYSDQELRLPTLACIKLMDHSNCVMIKNASFELGDSNIHISGGIWDQNNLGQLTNPFLFPHPQVPEYLGYGMLFQNVKNLHLTHLQLKDPVTFAVTMDTVSYFTVEDITFDFNMGNPWAVNMDGIHLNGNCHFGCMRNLKGTCYDDMVALNADEGTGGPITNIDIDGIYSENCHSAVRLLSDVYNVENVHIHNVFGTYYQYCIGITQSNARPITAFFDGLSIDNIFASKAERLPVYHKEGMYVYPLLFIEHHLHVKNITIANVFRTEKTTAVPTLYISRDSVVDTMSLNNITCINQIGEPMPLIENQGTIKRLFYSNLRADGDALIEGDGSPSVISEGCDIANADQ